MGRTLEQVHYGDAYEYGSIAANIALSEGFARVRVFTPTAAVDVTLPDATSLKPGGPKFILISEAEAGGEAATIKDADGGTVATIDPDTVPTGPRLCEVYLIENGSSAGSWHAEVVPYGSIPASPTAQFAIFQGSTGGDGANKSFDTDAGVWSNKTRPAATWNSVAQGGTLSDTIYSTNGQASMRSYGSDTWSTSPTDPTSGVQPTGQGTPGTEAESEDPSELHFIGMGAVDTVHSQYALPAAGTWTTQTANSSAQGSASRGIAAVDAIYWVGGGLSNPAAPSSTLVRKLGVAADSFSTVTSSSNAAKAQPAASFTTQGTLFGAGGDSTEADHVDSLAFTGESWSAKTAVPIDVRSSSATAVSGIAVVCVGVDTTSNSDEYYTYSPVGSGTFSATATIPDAPSPTSSSENANNYRAHHTAAG